MSAVMIHIKDEERKNKDSTDKKYVAHNILLISREAYHG